MGKDLRACPVCPACGSKKFRVIEKDEKTAIECLACTERIMI